MPRPISANRVRFRDRQRRVLTAAAAEAAVRVTRRDFKCDVACVTASRRQLGELASNVLPVPVRRAVRWSSRRNRSCRGASRPIGFGGKSEHDGTTTRRQLPSRGARSAAAAVTAGATSTTSAERHELQRRTRRAPDAEDACDHKQRGVRRGMMRADRSGLNAILRRVRQERRTEHRKFRTCGRPRRPRRGSRSWIGLASVGSQLQRAGAYSRADATARLPHQAREQRRLFDSL